MTYLSVFSGIEAVSVAWEPLGFTPLGFSEIKPFPCGRLYTNLNDKRSQNLRHSTYGSVLGRLYGTKFY